MNSLPEAAQFRSLLDAPLNALVDDARAAGRRAIGYTCSFVPLPLLSVDGLFPVRVRAPGASGTPLADTYLSSVICPYTRSLLEFAMDGQYDNLDGWVFTGSCDHLRRLYDNLEYLARPDFNHIMDLPHKAGDAALDWFMDEIILLARALTRAFHVDTDEFALKAAIARHNAFHAVLRDLSGLRKRDAPPLSGTDFHTLFTAASASPAAALLEPYQKILDSLRDAPGVPGFRARVLLAGSHLDDPEYIRIIESQGALVVADRFCTGSLPALDSIPETGNPVRALAAHSLRKTPCPRMMEDFDARVARITAAAREYAVHGVVLQTMKFCDCWGVESGPLVRALREAGLPVLRLEREYSLTGEGQLRTRIQAFLESLGR